MTKFERTQELIKLLKLETQIVKETNFKPRVTKKTAKEYQRQLDKVSLMFDLDREELKKYETE